MLEFIAETGSTNADLLTRIAKGETVREGDWLVANRQTSGRGRRGREWFDGAGNYMGSTVVQLRANDPSPGSLALLAGLALHSVVARYVSAPSRALLKWPNDLMIGNAKLAGILLERSGNLIVVGIGTNLRQAPRLSDRATIALDEMAPTVDRDGFAQELSDAFETELIRWRTEGLQSLIHRWTIAAHPIGTPLIVESSGEGHLNGTFAGLDDAGHLRLTLADGTARIIHAGDVSLDPNR